MIDKDLQCCLHMAMIIYHGKIKIINKVIANALLTNAKVRTLVKFTTKFPLRNNLSQDQKFSPHPSRLRCQSFCVAITGYACVLPMKYIKCRRILNTEEFFIEKKFLI